MAQTAEQFRADERRKMRLQAALSAKRNSIMNLSAARYNAMAQRPQTIQSRPVQSAGHVIADPARLPGQDIVDANNAEALAFANQFPGQNLTSALNSRAALRTGNDLANMRSAEVEREARAAVIQDQFRNNALEQAAPLPEPEIPTPLPAIQPTPLDYGPGLTPAAAEERYGPGGMFGTTPLPGGAYEQMGISPTMMGTQGARQSTRQTASAFPSEQRLKSSSNSLTDAVKKIKKRAGIIRGTAALVGGDSKAGDRYEAKALASLGVYAGQYGMSQLTDADFKDKQTLFQSMMAKNVPLDQILQVLESGVADKATGKAELKTIRDGSDFVTYQVYPDGSMKEFSRSPISASNPSTNFSVDLSKSGDAFGTKLGDAIGDVLGGGEDDVFEKLKSDNIQIGPLIDALESGQVQTGKGQEFFKDFKGLLGQFLPESKTQALFNKNAGMEEWWKSTVDSFVGLKLAMTKGAISDKEMKLFMDMIPSLSKTEDGNLILLRSMKALNNIALAQELGTLDYIKDLAKRGQDVGTESASQQTVDWYKFWNRRKELAIKDFHRVTKGYPETRDQAFTILSTDPKLKELDDEQIHKHLDQYYPEVSADG